MENELISQVLTQGDTVRNAELEGKYLTFWTGEQMFAVPIADVVQIVQMQDITEIPDFPSYAKGIIDLRGSVIPVIDVRLRLGKPEIPYDDHTCIIVTSIQGSLAGLLVDSVDEVTSIEDENISPPPTMASGMADAFLTGIGKDEKGVILLLDTGKMLNSNDFGGSYSFS